MIRNYILLTVALCAFAYGKVNPLLEKGATIKDIGSAQHVQYIQTPFTQISYPPTLNIVNNVIVYTSREITSAGCNIDDLDHETCPLDKEQCPVTKEYVTGSSVRGEEYLSCGALHSSSVYNAPLGKCELPSNVAKVCKTYTGSIYDSPTDKCVTTTNYRAPITSYQTVQGKFWWCGDSCNVYQLPNAMMAVEQNSVIQAAGGTYIKITGKRPRGAFSSYYNFQTDIVQPIYMNVNNGAWMKINPGENFEAFYKGILTASGETQSGGGKPTVYFKTDIPVYTCNAGDRQYVVNSTPWCEHIAYSAPKCDVNFFPERDYAVCRGDKQKYSFYTYVCPTSTNIYDNGYTPLDPGGDCGENSLTIDANSDGVMDQCNVSTPPTGNCERVNYICPLNAAKPCVTEATKRPLVNPAKLSGEYKAGEYGFIRDTACSNPDQNCLYSIENIVGTSNTLCFKDKKGEEGCFTAQGECTFDGIINDYLIYNKPLFSFLNSPDEVIDGYHDKIAKDFDSPTAISLDFNSIDGSSYPLEQVKQTASVGDQITIDFWMYWRGGKGMPVAFEKYDLWMSNGFGFNTSGGDLYGIADTASLLNSWHRITAVFTHKDILQNELYIDGIKQTLSEQKANIVHKNDLADITKLLQLSGWTSDTRYSLDSKIAGFNVYDGGLAPEQIKRLTDGGTNGGISRLRVYGNSITGYDMHNTELGVITSTCELSGKVGGFERTVQVEEETMMDTMYDKYQLRFPFKSITASSACDVNEYNMTFSIRTVDEITSAVFDYVQHGDYLAIWVNDTLVNVYPNGGTKLELIAPSTVDYGTGTGTCELGNPTVTNNTIDIRPYLKVGENSIRFKAMTAGTGSAGAAFEVVMPPNNIYCGAQCTLTHIAYDHTAPASTTILIDKTIADPIVSAKIIDNRISFWGSYNNAGEMGYIDILKYVNPVDIIDGYRHEFEEEVTLWNKGFTGFASASNDMTYAVSADPMTIAECQDKMLGTKYFLAERDVTDVVGIRRINELSLYPDDSFGDYCIIQKRGLYGNFDAEYAVTDATGAEQAYYCSPWNCENHQCGYAECQANTDGSLIKDGDKVNLLSTVCLEQKCDYTSPYFRYCGNPNGCDTNDPTVMEAQDGTCKKASCDNDDLFDSKTGSCEKLGCEFIEMDGKCVKKLY